MYAGSLAWLTGTPRRNTAIIVVISNTCAFPADKNQNTRKVSYIKFACEHIVKEDRSEMV